MRGSESRSARDDDGCEGKGREGRGLREATRGSGLKEGVTDRRPKLNCS